MKTLFTLLLLTPCLVLGKTQLPLYGFSLYGKPINPACLALIHSKIDSTPFIQQIDIAGCQNPGIGTMKIHTDKKGRIFIYKNNKDKNKGAYYYKVIGKTPNGIYVIHTFNLMPDKKIFDNIVFIKLFKKNEYIYKQSKTPHLRSYTGLKTLGYLWGGYKCSGGIKSAKLDGYQLYVSTYFDHQEHNICKLYRSYTINLKKIK